MQQLNIYTINMTFVQFYLSMELHAIWDTFISQFLVSVPVKVKARVAEAPAFLPSDTYTMGKQKKY